MNLTGEMFWWQSLTQRMAACNTDQDLEKLLDDECHQVGFEYYCHGIRAALSVTRSLVCIRGNYPADWVARYQERDYGPNDPTLAPDTMTSHSVTLWGPDFHERNPELFDEAREFGIVHGLTVVQTDFKNRLRGLSFSRGADKIGENELVELNVRMRCLVNLMCDVGIENLYDDATVSQAALTRREKEVLCWIANGKSSNDIANILNIAESTVNFHTANLVDKLEVSNRLQAAVHAVRLGLI